MNNILKSLKSRLGHRRRRRGRVDRQRSLRPDASVHFSIPNLHVVARDHGNEDYEEVRS